MSSSGAASANTSSSVPFTTLVGTDELARHLDDPRWVIVDCEQAAYMETAAEDDEIALRMDEGRRVLYAQGRSEVGPYQSPMEDGMQHFHDWYRAKLAL